jgi:hypothetical protein
MLIYHVEYINSNTEQANTSLEQLLPKIKTANHVTLTKKVLRNQNKIFKVKSEYRPSLPESVSFSES